MSTGDALKTRTGKNPVAHLTKYELHHLVEHLEALGQNQQLHQLLALETSEGANAWYEVKESWDNAVSYAQDIERAWAVAEQQVTLPSRRGAAINTAIALQCRYALIIGSLNSLASNVPPEALTAFVEWNVWTPAQVLAAVHRIPKLEQRATALIAIAPALCPEHVNEILELVQEIATEDYAVEVLRRIAPHMPQNSWESALKMVRTMTNMGHTMALVRLYAFLPESIRAAAFEEAVDTARQIDNVVWRIQALTELASCLADNPDRRSLALNEALAVTVSVPNEVTRLKTFVAVAALTSGSQRQELVQAVLSKLDAIEDEYTQIIILAGLIQSLPNEEDRRSVFRRVLGVLKKHWCENLGPGAGLGAYLDGAEILGQLCSTLPGDCMPEVLATINSIEFSYMRAMALAEVAPFLPHDLLREALEATNWSEDGWELMAKPKAFYSIARRQAELGYCEEALHTVCQIEPKGWQASAFTITYASLPTTAFGSALHVARGISDPTARITALEEIIPYLSPDEQAEVCEELLPVWRLGLTPLATLAKLIPHLLPETRETALKDMLIEAQRIRDEGTRAQALMGFSRLLPAEGTAAELWGAVADLALTARWPHDRSEVLSQVLPRLSDHDRDSLLLGLLEEARQPDPHPHSPAAEESESDIATGLLVALSPHFSERMMARVVQFLWDTRGRYDPADLLVALAPNVPPKLLDDMAALVETGLTESGMDFSVAARVLIRLLPRFPEHQQVQLAQRLLQIVSRVKNEQAQAEILREALPAIPSGTLPEVVRLTEGLENETIRLRMLFELLPYSKGSSVAEILKMVRRLTSLEGRARALAIIALQLSGKQRDKVWRDAMGIIETIESQATRDQLLSQLALKLALFEHTQEALATARRIGVREKALWTLLELARHLSADDQELLLPEILQLAESTGDRRTLSSRLIHLASGMQGAGRSTIWRTVLHEAQTIDDDNDTIKLALRQLIPILPRSAMDEASAAIGNVGQAKREDGLYLASLWVSRMAELGTKARGLDEGFYQALMHMEDSSKREEALSWLTPQVCELPPQKLYPLWCECLHIASSRARGEVLGDLLSMAPIVAALAGAPVLRSIVHSIEDVGRWWS